jgi:hypothetical protein
VGVEVGGRGGGKLTVKSAVPQPHQTEFFFVFIYFWIDWLVGESINIVREVESTFAGMRESPNTITIKLNFLVGAGARRPCIVLTIYSINL